MKKTVIRLLAALMLLAATNGYAAGCCADAGCGRTGCSGSCVSCSAGGAAQVVSAAGDVQMDAYAMQIVNETNYERTKQGLSALRVDASLTAAARLRAREIARSFSHTRPDGTSWRTVSPLAMGENIARGQKTSDKAIAAWMTSPGHRANILREGWGSIGVACVKAGGVYHWVQLFGK